MRTRVATIPDLSSLQRARRFWVLASFSLGGGSRTFVRSAPVLAKALQKRQTCRAGLLKRLGMGLPLQVVAPFRCRAERRVPNQRSPKDKAKL